MKIPTSIIRQYAHNTINYFTNSGQLWPQKQYTHGKIIDQYDLGLNLPGCVFEEKKQGIFAAFEGGKCLLNQPNSIEP